MGLFVDEVPLVKLSEKLVVTRVLQGARSFWITGCVDFTLIPPLLEPDDLCGNL